MSSPKSVAFRLAPMVHIYKRRFIRAASPFDENATNAFVIDKPNSVPYNTGSLSLGQMPPAYNSPVESPAKALQEPTHLSTLLESNWRIKDDSKAKLSISIPHVSFDDELTPISYDNTPFSYNTRMAIQEQRSVETELRKDALKEALNDFFNSITPQSQQTPTSIVMSGINTQVSPLSLSPKSPYPPLPIYHSASNLSECE